MPRQVPKPVTTATTRSSSSSSSGVIIAAILAAAALSWALTVQGAWLPDGRSPGSMTVMGMVGSLRVVVESLTLLVPFWLGAAGLGWLIVRALWPEQKSVTSNDTSHEQPRGASRIVLQLSLGLAALLIADWLLAWAGLLNIFTAWLLCGAGASVLLWRTLRWQKANPGRAIPLPTLRWELVAWTAPIALLLVAASCPPGTLWQVEAFGYDVMSYHLQLPREWLAQGRMTGLEHNVYSFLPSLIEAGFTQLSAMKGSVYGAIYACQLLHVSTAILGAAAIAMTVNRVAGVSGRGAGVLAGAAMLATPWVLVTGSCAYNDVAALCFGSAALLCVVAGGSTWRSSIAAGVLLGAATLAKLPAGPMFAVPIGLLILTRPLWCSESDNAGKSRSGAARSAVIAALIAAIVGAAMLVPYLTRNAVQTGNPVFPFATKTLGMGHWNDELSQRWKQGHAAEGTLTQRLGELKNQWFSNTGFGAVGGQARVREAGVIESRNVARFDQERGVSLLILAALLGAVAGLLSKTHRGVTVAMVLMILMQIGFWVTITHLQSRFLLPTLLPMCVLIGVGLTWLSHRSAGLSSAAGAALVILLSFVSAGVFWTQTVRYELTDAAGGRGPMVNARPWEIIDALPVESRLELLKTGDAIAGDHVLNQLVPSSGKVLMVADNARLLFVRRPMIYNSAFDANPLGEMWREKQGDAAAVTKSLRAQGVTHVWVHWSELQRLHATYGFDVDVTEATLGKMIRDGKWRELMSFGNAASCFELPE
jgi:hypothetical protein